MSTIVLTEHYAVSSVVGYTLKIMDKEQRPKVGIGVMVFKDGKVLMGKRKSSHGEGEWAWPGGHLEYMESF